MPRISRLFHAAGNALAFILLIALSLAQAPSAFASGGITQISSDPFTNSRSQHKTEVEPDNYAYGSTIVNTFQVGRFFGGGSSDIGWSTSSDNGQTWHNGFLPGTTIFATPPGPYAAISDPAVAYDAAHSIWMISSLALSKNNTPAILVSRSTDGGNTWSTPVNVFKQNGANFDKDWITCDTTASSRYYGHCYAEWDDNGHGNLIYMSASNDGGKTWSAPKTTANRAHGIGGQPLAQPNGVVVVTMGNAIDDHILAFRSTDGGATWSNTVVVSTANTYFENANFRSSALPTAAIDAAGAIYVVWEDCRFEQHCSSNDLVMSSSSDGVTWSAARRIPLDAIGSGVDHFIPGLGIDKTTSGSSAHLALTYYYFPNAHCSTKQCKLYAAFVTSTDGGSTWSTGLQLAGPMSLLWLATTSSGRMVGDYISTTFANGKAFPVFTAATAPGGGTYNEGMFTITGGLSMRVGHGKSAISPTYKPIHYARYALRVF